MKNYLPLILALCLVKLAVHMAGNHNYDFMRDELLHLSAGHHPAWGYFEFPPFIGWVARVSILFFDHSLTGMRLFATLAGVVIVVLCCMMAVELGGKKWAVFLAGVCALSFLPYYRNHFLFQPVAFDQMFWALGFYFILRFVNTQRNVYLLCTGITAGFGLMNKYTFMVWIAGILFALLFHEKARMYRNKWLYIAGAAAFLIFLPNMIWQYQHDIPFLLHMKQLAKTQLDKKDVFEFAIEQAFSPVTLLMSLGGLYFVMRQPRWRFLGIAFVTMFFLMWVLRSKSYYFFAAYPPMFAAGAVWLERIFQKRPYWNLAPALLLLAMVIPWMPYLIPILPVEKFIQYSHEKPDAEGHYKFTSDYADMFGWKEQVALADSIYNTLSPEDQQKCIFWAENYGEAGAIRIIGNREPVCRHGSFWTWGPGPLSGEIAISIGNEPDVVDRVYEEHQLIRIIKHPYAIEEENNIPVYLCRKPKIKLKEIWPTLEKQVFE
ncbi:glycosyltransferase family 39 protein [Chitinophaga barathri]|uniref:Phospholipid carrier-dependent glycosyltransferase n=1 Tax=Chitinophaga barathri TaxID=1647451 RepID=A0A3N4M987_9BACT|nr:glycosyltransferase family 39 protein [Chitinophaga barathri]RPD40071.1 phospholipid carrier-dependent glycosyltransferase [Chitinophaga barathri]